MKKNKEEAKKIKENKKKIKKEAKRIQKENVKEDIKTSNTKNIIILVIVLVLSALIGYFGTYFYDKYIDSTLNGTLSVKYEDTDYFLLEELDVFDKKDIDKIYPYKFEVKQSGRTTVLYQLIFNDKYKENDIDSKNLSYSLKENNKVISFGKISDIKNNILYESKLEKKKTNKYELTIYKSKEDSGTIYKYDIKLNAILDGKLGF